MGDIIVHFEVRVTLKSRRRNNFRVKYDLLYSEKGTSKYERDVYVSNVSSLLKCIYLYFSGHDYKKKYL